MNSIIANQQIAKRRSPPANARRGNLGSNLPSRGPQAWEFRTGAGARAAKPARTPPPRTDRSPRQARRRGKRSLPSAALAALAAALALVGSSAAAMAAEIGRRVGQLRDKFGQRRRSVPPRSPIVAPDPVSAPKPAVLSGPLQTPGSRRSGPSLRLRLPEALRRILSTRPSSALKKTAALAGAVALIATLVAMALSNPAFPLPEGELLPEDPSTLDAILSYVNPEPTLPEGEEATLPPAPATLEYQSYTVKKGDTLLSIANRYGRSLDTLIAINGVSAASAIRSGAVMRIPNMDGLVHLVKAGESVGSISAKYKTDATSILDANDLGSAVIRPGQSLFIPGARLPESELRRVLGVKLDWPLRGPISSYYGYRANPFTGVRQFHGGLDIVANEGTPVRAAMDGRIADVGYNSNFGNYIIVTHVDGLQTLYAHLSARSVSAGTRVQRGTVLGLSGNTGYSTGPHLHFGVYKKGISQNPTKFLN